MTAAKRKSVQDTTQLRVSETHMLEGCQVIKQIHIFKCRSRMFTDTRKHPSTSVCTLRYLGMPKSFRENKG